MGNATVWLDHSTEWKEVRCPLEAIVLRPGLQLKVQSKKQGIKPTNPPTIVVLDGKVETILVGDVNLALGIGGETQFEGMFPCTVIAYRDIL